MHHMLHIYEKPKLGSGLLRRIQAFNYRHKISAIGGFDTASCDIRLRDMSEAEQFLDQYIGNRIAVFVDNPVEPVWEGFINRMTFSSGNYQYTVSLDEMLNRVNVTYTVSGATNPTNSAASNNTASQSIYGIKAGKIELGFQFSAGTGVTSAQNTILAQVAYPKASFTQGGGGGLVTLEMLGFWHTLSWEVYQQTTAGVANISTDIIPVRILPNVANTTTFFDNGNTDGVEANALSMNSNRVRGQTIADVLTELAEVGDGTNVYVVGITPTDLIAGTRRLYYRAFNSTVEYTARRRDGLRLRNLYGQLEQPWFARPDKGIRISDMLLGWDGVGDDPRETWISSIEYNANDLTVNWTGTDDTTDEGAFQLNRSSKQHGRPFGAGRRFV